MIKAGRTPCCSAPRPGDQFTSQISPRLGLGGAERAWASFCFDCWGLGGCDCLASLLMQTYLNYKSSNHNVMTCIKKEAAVIKGFWEGTEVVVGFVE